MSTLNEQAAEALGFERYTDGLWRYPDGKLRQSIPDYAGDANEWMKLVREMAKEANIALWVFGPYRTDEIQVLPHDDDLRASFVIAAPGKLGEAVCEAFLETREAKA